LIRWPFARICPSRVNSSLDFNVILPSQGRRTCPIIHRAPIAICAGSNPEDTGVYPSRCSRPPSLRSTAPDGFQRGGGPFFVMVKGCRTVARQLGPQCIHDQCIQVPRYPTGQEHFRVSAIWPAASDQTGNPSNRRAFARDISEQVSQDHGAGVPWGLNHAPDHIRPHGEPFESTQAPRLRVIGP